jgi:hypothetical protein
MNLYIANPRTQHHNFTYQPASSRVPLTMMVPAGGQAMIPLDLRPDEIESIIRGHLRYGLFAASEMDRVRVPVWLIWDDKPIKPDLIARTIERNRKFTAEVSEIQQKAAAAHAAQALEQFRREKQLPMGPLSHLHLETTEVSPSVEMEGVSGVPLAPFEGTHVNVDMDAKRAAAGKRARKSA